jgi:hypothetical protein
MKVAIGIDPGDSTGIAIFEDAELTFTYQGPPKDALRVFQARLIHYEDDDVLIACERYIQQQGHGAMSHQPTAQQVVGKVQQIAESYGHVATLQAPSDAKHIVTQYQLKKAGLHIKPSAVDSPDANDVNMAVRHALLAMSRNWATLFDVVLYTPTDENDSTASRET